MTQILAEFIAPTFPALALAHFMALLSPGPDFFLVVGHAVRRGLRGTAFICLGIALGNALYIALAISGWSFVRQWPWLYRCVELAGACYLLWIGWALVRSGRQPADLRLTAAVPLAAGRQLLTGLASALLNPKNAIFYLTLMTTIMGSAASLKQQLFAGAWMAGLVFAWDAGLAAAIAHPAVQNILRKRLGLIEVLAGACLMLMAVLLVVIPLL
ncbi:MAG: LysE family translocator [Desulfovibrio sp.]|uniref:LysE family translocator n=1 Tax=Desulfovibrio sp. TaxID=885 RepID=UPI0039E5CC34